MFTRFAKSLISSTFFTLVGVVAASGVALADNCTTANGIFPDVRIANCSLWINSPAFAFDGHKAAAYLGRAFGYLQKSQYDLAVADYDMAIEVSPVAVEAYLGRGVTNVFLNDFWNAASDFQEALRLAPNDPKVKLLRNTLIAVSEGTLPRAVLLEFFESAVVAE